MPQSHTYAAMFFPHYKSLFYSIIYMYILFPYLITLYKYTVIKYLQINLRLLVYS